LFLVLSGLLVAIDIFSENSVGSVSMVPHAAKVGQSYCKTLGIGEPGGLKILYVGENRQSRF
jgi:hypothetical protein